MIKVMGEGIGHHCMHNAHRQPLFQTDMTNGVIPPPAPMSEIFYACSLTWSCVLVCMLAC